MSDIPIGTQGAASSTAYTQGVARAFLQKTVSPDQIDKDSRDILDKGFGTIIQSSEPIEKEKTLAALGRTFKTTMTEPYPAQMSMLSLMHHLSTPMEISGPVGLVVGKECRAISRDIEGFFNGKSAAIGVYRTGFVTIADSPQATPEEKAVAELGLEDAKAPLSEVDRFLASRVVMDFLASPLSAPIGSLITRASMGAAFKMRISDDAKHVLDAGFGALQNTEGTTEREKTLAGFGKDFGLKTSDTFTAALGKLMIMDSIAAGLPGTLGATISRISIDMLNGVDEPDFENDTLDNAFKTITASSLATEDEKRIAQEGLKENEDPGETSAKTVAARKFLLMKKISDLDQKTAQDALAHVPGSDEDSSVAEDEFVSIGGLKFDFKE